MEVKYTAEPWHQVDGMRVSATFYDTVGESYLSECVALTNELVKGGSQTAVQNARRIVACVNACAGIDNEMLENIVLTGETLKSRFYFLKSEK